MNDEEFIAKPYNPIDDAAEYCKDYENYSDNKLIGIKNQKPPQSAEHIAAEQILNKRAKTDRDRKHCIILIIAALTLVVALLTFLVDITNFSLFDIPPSPKKTTLSITNDK